MGQPGKILPLLLLLAVLSACGARTGLNGQRGGAGGYDLGEEVGGAAPQPTCLLDSDCFDENDLCNPASCIDGLCQPLPPVICDDSDPCTEDRCDPFTAACLFEPVSFDLDRDGFKGPRPGKKAGEPGSCGDDCDDTSPLAFPGGKELCDGVDNDCNGIIDDEAKFLPVDAEPVLISDPTLTQAYAAGLAYSGPEQGYLASYTGEEASSTSIYHRPLNPLGQPSGPPAQVNSTNGDATGGPLVWTGDRYGMAWSDRRDGNYEIYFNTFSPTGAKLGPDVRTTVAQGFSLNPHTAWNGTSFFVAWQDDRSGSFEIYGQKFSLAAEPIGNEVLLANPTELGDNAESPDLAASSLGVGLVYRLGNSTSSSIVFRPFDDQWKPKGAPVFLASGANYIDPSLVTNGTGFIIVWGQKQPFKVLGAAVDFQGNVLVPPRELSPPDGAHYRRPLALSLGNRMILTYSRQQADGYELFSRTFSADLTPQSPQQQLTQRLGDDFGQSLLFGPDGDVAVYFDGKLTEPLRNAAFLTRLRCDASVVNP
ncbi:MAG: putative metal-binding motif-containing protein [Myxococcales bacterium]|nr:putative metal-binding motif-containing protein [Polyangiaceae bacterium]MDW8247998.1 putative metal-binding motif-containing protein [Myxococcales bacterium]